MSTAGNLPDSPATTALTALGGWSLFVALRLWQVGSGDIGTFVVAGTTWTDASSGLPLSEGPGYDGQFFHRLATDPFSAAERVAGTLLDTPARLNRIGYPGLARVFGVAGLPAEWALVVVNLIAVMALGLLGGVIARSSGRHAMWGLLLPGYFGFAFSMSRNLAEVVATAALVAALWAAHSGRHILGALAMTLAVLSRETVILAVVVIGVVELVGLLRRTRQVDSRDALWLAPGLGLLIWQIAVRDRWGEVPLLAGDVGRLRPPGSALIEQLPTLVDPTWLGEGWLRATHTLEVVVLWGVVIWAATRLRQIDRGSPVVPAFVGLVVGASIIDVTEGIWVDRNDLRMFADLYAVAVIVLLLTRVRLRLPVIGVGICTALASLSFLSGV